MGAACCQNIRTTARGTSHQRLWMRNVEVLFIVHIKNYSSYKFLIFYFFKIWIKYLSPLKKYFLTRLCGYINSSLLIFFPLRNSLLCFNTSQCPKIQSQDFIMANACLHLNVNISFMREIHSMKKRGKNKQNDVLAG